MARSKQAARKSTGRPIWSPNPNGLYIAKKSASVEVKRPYRFHPGTVALREIRKFQKSPDPLIPRMSFERLVREIAQGIDMGLRFQNSSIDALQQAAESYVVELFEGANICAIHAKRVTVTREDLKVARAFKGDKF